MKTNPFLEYILYDVLSDMGAVTFLPMMGGYVLYFEGKVFALVSGEEFYLKETKSLLLGMSLGEGSSLPIQKIIKKHIYIIFLCQFLCMKIGMPLQNGLIFLL